MSKMRIAVAMCISVIGPVLSTSSVADDAREARRLAGEARRAEMMERRSSLRDERNARAQDLRDRRLDRQNLCDRIGSYLAGISTLPAAAQGSRQAGAASAVPYESWLLQDALFVPAFGERFDALGLDEAQRFKSAGTNCMIPAGEGGQRISDPMLFYRAFTPPHSDRYKRGVVEIRAKNAEAERMAQVLKSLSADQDAVARYGEMSTSRRTTGAFLMPQARDALDQAFVEAYRRVVAPAQAEQLKVAARNAQGVAGLRSLAALRDRVQSTAASAGVPAALPDAFVQRYDALLTDAAAQERRKIDALGGGLEGLERGVAWRREFERDIARIDGSLSSLTDYFFQKRSAVLAEARPQLLAGISETTTEADLLGFLARYVPLASDQRGDAGTAIASAVEAQRSQLRKSAVLARNEGPSGIPQVVTPQLAPSPQRPSSTSGASAGGEPTEAQMYDAFKDRVDSVNAELATTIAQCNRREYKAGGGDPALALQCLSLSMGAGLRDGGQNVNTPSVGISRFKKIACEKAEGRAGYFCDFVAGVQTTMRNVPPSFVRMMSEGENRQGRFVPQGSSWILLDK